MPDKPTAKIAKINFSGGSSFELSSEDKVLLVGPNNSGKSQALREILGICQNGEKERAFVVTEVELQKSGSATDLKNFLEAKADYQSQSYRYEDWSVHESNLSLWDQPYLKNQLVGGFIKRISANERLNICEQQSSIAPGDQKSKPQHVLYDDEELTTKISALFRRAFGADIMFDFRGGSRLPIHVGGAPANGEVVDRVGDAYVNAVREKPLLDKQGDGMKSYAGILFEAVVANRDITLIDEPEAFLHPPQMRKLGETLSSDVVGQLIVATHSSDVMRGFLEGTQGKVRILRIRREEDINIVSEAEPLVIKELWEKPELRYSNALDGVFHEQTIICEDDSDCRLLNAVADHISSVSDLQWKDTAYVPTGGKHGISKIAAVLRKIGVPVKAVFDIDFLSERELVESTVNAFGGQWQTVQPLWQRVEMAVRSGIKPKTVAQIKEDIVALLEQAEDGRLPKGDVIEAMKQGKPWAEVKKYGSRGIPRGDAQRDYEALRDELEKIGIYLVPVGEIENFCPEIGSHGPKFAMKLLSTVPLADSRLEELRAFVEKVHEGSFGAVDSATQYTKTHGSQSGAEH
ncbi:AAA family ATPase [Salinisphaera sp. SPP-AMP-43]|uniref:ATP-dependent nuclease n=1 Tax=Salinisphaera sp. SPP-AMP-43 TaxID=3121288 RepID=UPI003C6E4D94